MVSLQWPKLMRWCPSIRAVLDIPDSHHMAGHLMFSATYFFYFIFVPYYSQPRFWYMVGVVLQGIMCCLSVVGCGFINEDEKKRSRRSRRRKKRGGRRRSWRGRKNDHDEEDEVNEEAEKVYNGSGRRRGGGKVGTEEDRKRKKEEAYVANCTASSCAYLRISSNSGHNGSIKFSKMLHVNSMASSGHNGCNFYR